MRKLTMADQVVSLLEGYDSALSKEGFPSPFISLVAESLFRAVFIHVPNGQFPESNPQYLGLDPGLPGYSMYAFCDGPVSGSYSSSPDHVIIHAIDVQRPAIPNRRSIVARASTAA